MSSAVVAASLAAASTWGATNVSTSTCQTLSQNSDCYGQDLSQVAGSSAEDCCDICAQTEGCLAFTHIWGNCYLKNGCSNKAGKDGATAGQLPIPPVPAPPTPSGPTKGGVATLFQTAHGTSDLLTQKEDVQFYEDFDFDGPVIDVSSRVTNQAIIGFGGAFTEAAALVYQGMSATNQEKFMEKYFDAEKGIGFTLGRVHINSCDFSPSPAQWSLDDVDGDFNLEYFDTNATHDKEAMIPLILAGMDKIRQSNRELKLFASPWSPPAWMKTNGQMVGGGKLKPECSAVWADYFVKWIDAYKAAGVPLWAVTPQNEPENAAGWEACVYTADEEADWIGNELGPKLQAAHPEVLILPHDHNKDHVQLWADTMFSHPTAAQYVSGMAFHWYSGDEFDHVAQIHKKYPDAVLLPTEATWEKYRWGPETTVETGEWFFGEGYAHDILGDLNSGAQGWTDWNLLLDQDGGPNHLGNNCDAPMMADNGKQELYLHPQYYFIGHFSKFLVPGSKHLTSAVSGSTSYTGGGRGYGSCSEEDGVEATAFLRPDNVVAVVVLNCGASPQNFKLKDGDRAAAVQIPASSIQTFLFNTDAFTQIVV